MTHTHTWMQICHPQPKIRHLIAHLWTYQTSSHWCWHILRTEDIPIWWFMLSYSMQEYWLCGLNASVFKTKALSISLGKYLTAWGTAKNIENIRWKQSRFHKPTKHLRELNLAECYMTTPYYIVVYYLHESLHKPYLHRRLASSNSSKQHLWHHLSSWSILWIKLPLWQVNPQL